MYTLYKDSSLNSTPQLVLRWDGVVGFQQFDISLKSFPCIAAKGVISLTMKFTVKLLMQSLCYRRMFGEYVN